MTLYAVSTVRDEADIIGPTVAHLLAEGVDRVLLIDNGSTDRTAAILAGFPRVEVQSDPDPRHIQGERITRLARQAHAEGADWVLPFDADELFYADGETLAAFFAGRTEDAVAVQVWDHLVTDDDAPGPNPWQRVKMRRPDPQRHPKVAFRASATVVVAEGNHGLCNGPPLSGRGVFARHLQYRSFEQMIRKVRNGAAAMDAAGIDPQHGMHWRAAAALSVDDLYRMWRNLCRTPGLIEDAAPWRG